MQRKIVSDYGIGFVDKSKSSAGFANDIMYGETIQPSFLKISDSDAFRLYHGNEWINAVVNRIIDDCTKLKPVVALADKNQEVKPRHKKVFEHWNNFMMKPNPNKESFNQLREKFIKDMLVVGRGVMEKVSLTNVVNELYALKAGTVKIVTDKHGTIPDKKAFLQKSKPGDEVWFDKDELVWCVFRPKSGTAYGEKPLDTLANAVATDILRASYNSNFFTNSAEAGGILSLEGLNKTDLKKFRQYWQLNHKGVSKAHRTMAVNVPVKWIQNTITNRDLQFSEYGKELMAKIFAVYSMQPFVMGVVDGTTGKLNSREQYEIYKDSAIKPILAKEAWAYTQEILHDGWGLNEFVMEFEGVDLADITTQSLIDRLDINSCIVTINEVRSRRGMQPVPWGNTPVNVLPGGNQIDPDTGRIVPPSSQDGAGESKPKPKEDKKPKEEKKPAKEKFIEDAVGTFKGFTASFDVETSLKYLAMVMEASKYVTNVKQQAMYENVLSQMCERYSQTEEFEIEDIQNYLLENL